MSLLWERYIWKTGIVSDGKKEVNLTPEKSEEEIQKDELLRAAKESGVSEESLREEDKFTYKKEDVK